MVMSIMVVVHQKGYQNITNLKLRNDYNKDITNNTLFYTVIIFSFNSQIRFNSKGEFNMPVGKRDFNKSIRSNIINFVGRMNNTPIYFTNKDFREVNIKYLKNNFIYADPPYLISSASYNGQDGWGYDDEMELLRLLDKANKKGVKFALSNVLESKGKSNDILKKWSKKYNVIHLNKSYSNCNYHRKERKNVDDEILVVNY